MPDFVLPPPLLEALLLRAGGVRDRVEAPDPAEAAVVVEAPGDARRPVRVLDRGDHEPPVMGGPAQGDI